MFVQLLLLFSVYPHVNSRHRSDVWGPYTTMSIVQIASYDSLQHNVSSP